MRSGQITYHSMPVDGILECSNKAVDAANRCFTICHSYLKSRGCTVRTLESLARGPDRRMKLINSRDIRAVRIAYNEKVPLLCSCLVALFSSSLLRERIVLPIDKSQNAADFLSRCLPRFADVGDHLAEWSN